MWGEWHIGSDKTNKQYTNKQTNKFCLLAESLESLKDSLYFPNNHYMLLWRHIGRDNWNYFSVLCWSEIGVWPWILLNIHIKIEPLLSRVEARVKRLFLIGVPGYVSTFICILITFYYDKSMPGNSKTSKIKTFCTLNCCLLHKEIAKLSKFQM